MVNRKTSGHVKPTKFFRFPEITVDGFLIEKGEVIKIKDLNQSIKVLQLGYREV